MLCPECNRSFEGVAGACPRCGAVRGVIKTSTIFIARGERRVGVAGGSGRRLADFPVGQASSPVFFLASVTVAIRSGATPRSRERQGVTRERNSDPVTENNTRNSVDVPSLLFFATGRRL